jgi:hypothetical protein
MRYALIAMLVLAGCGDSIHAPDAPSEEAGNEGTTVQIDPALLNNPTSELGTERTRPVSKTIDWPAISTDEGASFLDEAVVIDRILRDDASNMYAVRVRLKNTTKDVQKLSWIFRFTDRRGAMIAGYEGGLGKDERWQGTVIEPFGYATISDSARIMGAEGFRLFVRSGKSGDGSPDDPSPEKKEERRQKREAAKAAAPKK